jgi:hypothetical protein
MKNLTLLATLSVLFLLGACSTGGPSSTDQETSQPTIESGGTPRGESSGIPTGPSEEGRAYIIEVCSPIYNFDWTQTSIDSLIPYKNDFNQFKNRAASFDETTKSVIASLASQAEKLTEANLQWLSDKPDIFMSGDNMNYADQLEAALNKVFETTSTIGEEIDKICAPFFQ